MVTQLLRPVKRRHEVEKGRHLRDSPKRPSPRPASQSLISYFLLIWILSSLTGGVSALRCYVCGGSTGRECEEIVTRRRWSPYVRPRPVLTSDGKRQWEECNDLINNKGCIKQVVNGGKKKL